VRFFETALRVVSINNELLNEFGAKPSEKLFSSRIVAIFLPRFFLSSCFCVSENWTQTQENAANQRQPPAGWRRCIGSLKLQVSVCKRATNCRALLRKSPMKIRHPMGLRHPVHVGLPGPTCCSVSSQHDGYVDINGTGVLQYVAVCCRVLPCVAA